jgi:hypothetical protein
MFVQKIREAIRYAQLLEAPETALQKIEGLHTREVDRNMQNILRALNAYRVAFGKDETNQKPLADVMLEVIAHWNESSKVLTGPSFGGPPSVLGVMLLHYMQRLQGTSFVPATFVVKPATVMVLLMLAIKYNDDYSPDNPGFFRFLVPYAAMMRLSLSHLGMPFTAPRFADLEPTELEPNEYTPKYHKGYCAFKKCLSKRDKQAFENEKQTSGLESAITLYTAKINHEPVKNLDKKIAMWALQALELELLSALGWKLDVISTIPPPLGSNNDDQGWSLRDHTKHDSFWFWKNLAQINPDQASVR